MLRLLDLFCGAGGAARGYQFAGFHVTGVDSAPQPHYCGDAFIQADALEYLAEHGAEYDAIHASPPCQAYSLATPEWAKTRHPRLIPDTRRLLGSVGLPHVIENVGGARRELDNPLMLCGSMFGLRVWRHRYFEVDPPILLSAATCRHNRQSRVTVDPGSNARRASVHRNRKADYDAVGLVTITGHVSSYCGPAMGIDWMTGAELSQAIPPAYTEYIGAALRAHLTREANGQQNGSGQPVGLSTDTAKAASA